jgi:hypothetical protein
MPLRQAFGTQSRVDHRLIRAAIAQGSEATLCFVGDRLPKVGVGVLSCI